MSEPCIKLRYTMSVELEVPRKLFQPEFTDEQILHLERNVVDASLFMELAMSKNADSQVKVELCQ